MLTVDLRPFERELVLCLVLSYYCLQILSLLAGFPMTLLVKLPLKLYGPLKYSAGLGLAKLPCIALDISR